MKTKFSNSELPHIWIHEQQESGKGSNMFFENKTIYSYGYHFPIARIINNDKGKAVLWNDKSYSSSTSKHQSYVSRSIPSDMLVFSVHDLVSQNAGNLSEVWIKCQITEYEKQIVELSNKAKRARKNKTRIERSMISKMEECNQFCDYFGIDYRIDENKIKTLRLAIEENLKLQKEQEKIQEAKRQEELKEKIDLWKQGEINSLPYCEKTFLRIKNDNIETSKGINVPVTHAKLLYALVLKVMESSIEWIKNGKTFHIGQYSVDRIETNGTIHAGCHVIEFDEINRIGMML